MKRPKTRTLIGGSLDPHWRNAGMAGWEQGGEKEGRAVFQQMTVFNSTYLS